MSEQPEAPEPALPAGCVWKKAVDLKPWDQVATEDGGFSAVDHIERANWIKTSEGSCVWIFYRNSRGDQIAGKSDEFAVKAA